MAAEPDETQNTEPETALWGTWEELLLACAVHRHGTKSWESVAVEVQKRSSAAGALSPRHCEQKYRDLKRRYGHRNATVLSAVAAPGDGGDDENAGTVPWLNELRKIRVEELRREVERCDLSIVSLQHKVKRLKEERGRSVDGVDESDLEKSVIRIEEDDGKVKKVDPLAKLSPVAEPLSVDPVTGEDNRSVNESNSTDSGNPKTGLDSREPKIVERACNKPVRDDSCNGSSDSVEKNPVRESVKVEPDRGEDFTAKESSDVQSSAGKEGERDKTQSGYLSGDEPGNEDQSPAVKRSLVKLQPLVQVLEMVRSHKLGSAFERRLMSQEAGDHKDWIRQHIDVLTIQARLEEGCYLDFDKKFFRDLLLLLTNAMVFFCKNSPEFAAAGELQSLISREIYQRCKKSELPTREHTSLLPKPLKPEPEPEPSDSFLLKPKISVPMIVCRKRSSIASKASGSSSGGERKKVQKAALLEDKPLLDWKQPDKSLVDAADETGVTRKRASDRYIPISKTSKKNGKSRTNSNQNKTSEAPSSQNQPKGSSSKEPTEAKSDKNNTSVSGSKKRNATTGTSKTRQKLSTLLESLKNSEVSPSNSSKGGTESKRLSGSNGKGERKREPKGQQVTEQESPVKRNSGRSAKRVAVAPPSVAASSKRSRGGGDSEIAASRQPKKRSRR